ncbi:MAG TPA: DUF2007 domain-containing protein [Desulfomonilaceae bacterium]|nr:DUF2007 domain-containing protein [Desulfomonilaceae bacterium]
MDLDEAVVLRTYPDEPMARIVASRLEAEDIEVHIRKEDCGGAYPSLQLPEGVRLFVKPEDLEAAEEILKEIEAEDSGTGERQGEQREQEDRKVTRSSPILLIGLFLLGSAAGYFLSPELTNRSTYTGTRKGDRNEQGVPGTLYYYVDGGLARAEEDRNYDGKPDAWHKYVAGKVTSSEYDDNFDGRPDVWVTYKDRFNFIMKVDTDFDGKPDATVFYVNGMKQRVDWYPHDSAIIERSQFFESEVLKEELVDTDGDGVFDLKITYDRYERPVGKAKCWIPN